MTKVGLPLISINPRLNSLSKLRGQKGFTLIEILVALVILSFMMISIYTIVDDNIMTKETIISEDRNFLQAYTAMHRLEEDISQMYNPLYFSSVPIQSDNANGNRSQNSNPYIQNASVFVPSELFPRETVKNQPVPVVLQEDKTSLQFMTASNKRFIQGQRQSRFAWVHYSLEADDRENTNNTSNDKPQNQLVRRHIPYNVWDRNLDILKVKPQVLLRGVKEITFQFWSRNDLKFVDNIRLLPSEERETIRAIRVALVWVDDSNAERDMVRIFRPLWPYFDAIKDETERQAAKKASSGGNNGQNPTGGPGQPPANNNGNENEEEF